MKKENTKLRLHLWTKEEYKEKAISNYVDCRLKDVTEIINPSNPIEDMILKETKDEFIEDIFNLYLNRLDVRTPSLSFSEIPKFIESASIRDSNAIADYICLDNNIYKYVDIYYKHLLSNGSIQIYIDGINYTENPTCYNIDRALATAMNATDNSLKFKHAIASK